MLLAAAGFALFSPQLPPVAALPLIALALLLHPGRPTTRSPSSIREERRSQFLSSLENEAQQLRKRYVEASRFPLSQGRTQEQWQIGREAASWIASAESQFRAFPEFRAIFEAHQKRGDVIYELDSCISRLGELRRLCLLSRKLKLPIDR